MYFRKLFGGLAQSRMWRAYRRCRSYEQETSSPPDAKDVKLPSSSPPNKDVKLPPEAYPFKKLLFPLKKLVPSLENSKKSVLSLEKYFADVLASTRNMILNRKKSLYPDIPKFIPPQSYKLLSVERDDSLRRCWFPIRVAVSPEPMTSMTTLPNKLRVASQTSMEINATVVLWIDFNSRFEIERTNGFGKFIEQMTLRYPSELKKGIKKVGGNLVTDISREQTYYYFTGHETYICEVLDLFANFLQRPSFDIDIINEMKCAMLREIEEGEGQAGKGIFEHLHAAVFSTNYTAPRVVEGQASKGIFEHLHAAAFNSSPLSKTILGSAENVKSITKQHLEDYISTNYTAPRVVVLACGKYNHRNIVELVKKKFTNLSHDPTIGFQLVAQSPASFTGSEVCVIDDDIKLAQFAIAFKGAAASDRDSVTLMVMQKLLGSFSRHLTDQPDHGILGQQIRSYIDVESVMAFNLIYKDIGLFGVNAVATRDCCLKDLVHHIMSAIWTLSYEIDEYHLYEAREKLKSDLVAIGSSQVAKNIGCQILTFGRRTPDKVLYKEIDAVSKIEVERLANRFLDEEFAIAALGPVKDLPDFNCSLE